MGKTLLALCIPGVLFVAGCGGGGGGSVDDDGAAPAFPTSGRFSMGGGPFTGSVSFGGPAIEATASNLNLAGTFNRSTDLLTVDAGKGVRVDTVQLFEPMQVTVTSTYRQPFLGVPTAGAFRIETATYRIEVTVDTSAPAGVIIKQALPAPVVEVKLPWSAFTDIEIGGTAAPAYQQMAALSWQILGFALGELSRQAWWLQIVAQNETAMQQAGSGHDVSVPGEYCPLTHATGDIKLKWSDSPTEDPRGEVGPADNFTQQFNQFWRNNAEARSDRMYASGTLTLSNYLEMRNPTKLGFGGVSYDHVVTRDVDELSPGVFEYGPTVTVTGGYSVLFSAQ